MTSDLGPWYVGLFVNGTESRYLVHTYVYRFAPFLGSGWKMACMLGPFAKRTVAEDVCQEWLHTTPQIPPGVSLFTPTEPPTEPLGSGETASPTVLGTGFGETVPLMGSGRGFGEMVSQAGGLGRKALTVKMVKSHFKEEEIKD